VSASAVSLQQVWQSLLTRRKRLLTTVAAADLGLLLRPVRSSGVKKLCGGGGWATSEGCWGKLISAVKNRVAKSYVKYFRISLSGSQNWCKDTRNIFQKVNINLG